MLLSLNGLKGFKIQASDGEIGKIRDIIFEEESRAIRYLVVRTGSWLERHEVLLSPSTLGRPDGKNEIIPVDLTRDEVGNSPDISCDPPISRKEERKLFLYYNWPMYWAGDGTFGGSMPPVPVPPADEAAGEEENGPGLRSGDEIEGYHVKATDGEIGHINDLVIDDEVWVLRYLAVDTRDWFPGKKVLVAVGWVEEIDWLAKQVTVGLSRQKIEKSPPYDPHFPVNREYEDRIFDYYGKPKYWER